MLMLHLNVIYGNVDYFWFPIQQVSVAETAASNSKVNHSTLSNLVTLKFLQWSNENFGSIVKGSNAWNTH